MVSKLHRCRRDRRWNALCSSEDLRARCDSIGVNNGGRHFRARRHPPLLWSQRSTRNAPFRGCRNRDERAGGAFDAAITTVNRLNYIPRFENPSQGAEPDMGVVRRAETRGWEGPSNLWHVLRHVDVAVNTLVLPLHHLFRQAETLRD